MTATLESLVCVMAAVSVLYGFKEAREGFPEAFGGEDGYCLPFGFFPVIQEVFGTVEDGMVPFFVQYDGGFVVGPGCSAVQGIFRLFYSGSVFVVLGGEGELGSGEVSEAGGFGTGYGESGSRGSGIDGSVRRDEDGF